MKNKKFMADAGRRRNFREKGMSLLEVLVAMLVIGLGLAMSISMIQIGNRFGENAEFTSSALQQAQAIIDKIRANNMAAQSYVFTGGHSAGAVSTANYAALYPSADMSSFPSGLADCTKPNCADAQTVAKADMVQWRNNLQASLPGGRGLVVDYGQGNYEVLVMWNFNPEADMENNKTVDGVRIRFAL